MDSNRAKKERYLHLFESLKSDQEAMIVRAMVKGNRVPKSIVSHTIKNFTRRNAASIRELGDLHRELGL